MTENWLTLCSKVIWLKLWSQYLSLFGLLSWNTTNWGRHNRKDKFISHSSWGKEAQDQSTGKSGAQWWTALGSQWCLFWCPQMLQGPASSRVSVIKQLIPCMRVVLLQLNHHPKTPNTIACELAFKYMNLESTYIFRWSSKKAIGTAAQHSCSLSWFQSPSSEH